MANRIVYVSPVLHDYDAPVGGIRVIYRHVELLNRNGYDAVVWNYERGGSAWFSSSAETIEGESLQLDSSDTLVFPRGLIVGGSGADPAPGCRKVVFNQWLLPTLPLGAPAQNSGWTTAYFQWDPPPCEWVISKMSLEVMTRLISKTPVEHLHYVPLAIDVDLFRPARICEPKVTWMPRKKPVESDLLLNLFSADNRFKDVSLVPIHGLSEEEVAAELGSSSVFVALGGDSEGFGLPAAEALAAGCSVVGYPGGGGEEVFECAGAYPVRTGDVVTILEKVASLIERGPTDEQRAGYHDWIAARYNESRQFEHLKSAILSAQKVGARTGRATHPYAMPGRSGTALLADEFRELLRGS